MPARCTNPREAPQCSPHLVGRPANNRPTWAIAFRFLALVGASPSWRMQAAMSSSGAAAMEGASGARSNSAGVHSFTFLSVVYMGGGGGEGGRVCTRVSSFRCLLWPLLPRHKRASAHVKGPTVANCQSSNCCQCTHRLPAGRRPALPPCALPAPTAAPRTAAGSACRGRGDGRVGVQPF